MWNGLSSDHIGLTSSFQCRITLWPLIEAKWVHCTQHRLVWNLYDVCVRYLIKISTAKFDQFGIQKHCIKNEHRLEVQKVVHAIASFQLCASIKPSYFWNMFSFLRESITYYKLWASCSMRFRTTCRQLPIRARATMCMCRSSHKQRSVGDMEKTHIH